MPDFSKMPTTPPELRLWLSELRRVFNAWATATDYKVACQTMKDLKRMINADLGEK